MKIWVWGYSLKDGLRILFVWLEDFVVFFFNLSVNKIVADGKNVSF